ncbi:MAG TPA: sialate O-acetylesterase [Pirellulales bacterium]|nr:sialate O-acetylesterase [Pirellulales bacterium]
MTCRLIVRLTLACAATWLLAASAPAAVKPHALFSDNCVLQQKVKVPVWGTTEAAEKVTVSIAGKEASAMPRDGKWRVELPALTAGGPHVLSISQGGDNVELKNVLVGEVWICGGQSNMQWELKQSDGGTEAIATAGNPKLRLFTVPRHRADNPESEVAGAWTVAGPDTAGDFTAVGYYFGRDLQKELAVPVGLISSNVGGTAAEEWMSKDSIDSNPELKNMTKPQNATTLYNAMIAPLAPFAIKGAIWYQGESNAGRAYQYRTLLPAMIKNWRDTFGQGDFPFLIVQIAPYEAIVHEPQDSAWAEIRDAQRYVVEHVPNTALVVTTDVGDEKDIHPRRKEPVGHRLSLAARAVAYGEKVEFSGPVYEGMSVTGDQATLRFTHATSGLVAKGGPLTGFTIAGEDKKFYNAQAKIVGNTVVVSSDKVAKPVAVRYGWAAYPVVNLWNGDDLPASPFRTDSFPITTQDKK